jgi:hypothetical protein
VASDGKLEVIDGYGIFKVAARILAVRWPRADRHASAEGRVK